jgi:hypothetical protein
MKLAGASVLVVCGLAFVYTAKTQNFPDVSERLRHGGLVNLNAVSSVEQLTPSLDAADAEKVLAFLRTARPLRNVGTFSRLRRDRKPLLPVARLKPGWVVRTPNEFRRAYLIWSALYFSGFYLVWFVWRARRFPGDAAILPALHLLTGMGLILMVSLRDPLRDTLEFRKFALGVFLGCSLLLLPLVRAFDYRRLADWIYTPLLAAFVLFALLLLFGSGPGTSDQKVNLGPFQPVEAIKILVVLFLAGYFARNWERLRDLRQKGLRGMGVRLGVPRLAHLMPVACAVAVAILLFFVLKDLGPALVLFFLFLTLCASATILDSPAWWWTASICGSRLGITTYTAATNWRMRCGRFRREAFGAPARAMATPARSRRAARTWCCRPSAKSGVSRAWRPCFCCSDF